MLLSYKKSLYKDFPYPVVGVDLRSPNIKFIDEQLDVLGQEIVRMLDINRNVSMVGKDYPTHGFDLAHPEEIQQAIGEGRIKPFERIKSC